MASSPFTWLKRHAALALAQPGAATPRSDNRCTNTALADPPHPREPT